MNKHIVLELVHMLIIISTVSVPVLSADVRNIQHVKKVHLIFMNHLDVGFDGLGKMERGFINNVVNKYFQVYFPQAIQVSEQLRLMGYYETMVYTTHPWLVSLYVDCPPNLILAGIKLYCPTSKELSQFTTAVKRGDITWHAGPMNMQFEMMVPSMVEFSLNLSADLDSEFQIHRQHRTLSQRDVPGMTQAMIPLLSKAGIEAVTVGVNGASAPPVVPRIFRWAFNNSSVIAMWHPGGYPDTPGPVPGVPGGLSRNDCVTIPGHIHALCFAFRNDNSGPPQSIQEVLRYYEIARSQFPGADVQASHLEDFVASLNPDIVSKLPLITQEIGDTWIQGCASDPRKMAEMRILMRAMADCMKHACNHGDRRVYNASRLMIKLAEHTWGLDSIFDRVNYVNQQFYEKLSEKSPNFLSGVASWQEQRNISYISLEALGSHPLVADVKAKWKALDASLPDLTDYMQVASLEPVLSCRPGYQFQFSADGSIRKLRDPYLQIDWAGGSGLNPLGQFVYQTYNQSDFDYFEKHYGYGKFWLGIGKPNITQNARPKSQVWPTKLVALYQRKAGNCDFLVHIEVVDKESVIYYGAPQKVWVRYSAVAENKNSPGIEIELQWFKKAPTRLPEALFFVFSPVKQPGYRWLLHKLGQLIDPLNVVLNGSQTLHGIDRGVFYRDHHSIGLEIESHDAGLVNLLTSHDRVSSLPLPLAPLKDVSGVAFNLFNNIWDVNYIFWYPYERRDVNQKFRFSLKFIKSQR